MRREEQPEERAGDDPGNKLFHCTVHHILVGRASAPLDSAIRGDAPSLLHFNEQLYIVPEFVPSAQRLEQAWRQSSRTV